MYRSLLLIVAAMNGDQMAKLLFVCATPRALSNATDMLWFIVYILKSSCNGLLWNTIFLCCVLKTATIYSGVRGRQLTKPMDE